MVGLIVGSMIFFSMITAWILFFFINFTTVRRLRKNPITKDGLGFHLFWGWYALNMSLALFVSKKRMIKRRSHSDGYLFADPDLMRQYTTPFEKIICKLLIVTGLFGVLGLLIFGLLDDIVGFDIFDY